MLQSEEEGESQQQQALRGKKVLLFPEEERASLAAKPRGRGLSESGTVELRYITTIVEVLCTLN